jgi:hypothetical protein
MPYESINQNKAMGIGKGSRLKEREIGIWTVSSPFSGSTSVKITLILLDESTGNTFYNKHVQRRGESPEFVKDLRNPRTTGGDIGYSMSQVGMGVLNANFNKSTTIRLDRIDLSHMLYKMAEALYAASAKIPLGIYQGHLAEVDFEIGDAVAFMNGAKKSFCSSIAIGGTKTADDGTKMTFDISHGVTA